MAVQIFPRGKVGHEETRTRWRIGRLNSKSINCIREILIIRPRDYRCNFVDFMGTSHSK